MSGQLPSSCKRREGLGHVKPWAELPDVHVPAWVPGPRTLRRAASPARQGQVRLAGRTKSDMQGLGGALLRVQCQRLAPPVPQGRSGGRHPQVEPHGFTGPTHPRAITEL